VIAKGGLNWVALPLALGIVFTLASVMFQSYLVYVAANVSFFLSIVFIIIFRDPPRSVGKGVVSPADGRVLDVDRMLNAITITTGVFAVHVCRAPVSGRILDVQWDRRASEPSRSNTPRRGNGMEIGIASRLGIVRVRLEPRLSFPGMRPYVFSKTRLRKGQRIGSISLKALVTIYLPSPVEITVRKGKRVIAGETPIGGLARNRM